MNAISASASTRLVPITVMNQASVSSDDARVVVSIRLVVRPMLPAYSGNSRRRGSSAQRTSGSRCAATAAWARAGPLPFAVGAAGDEPRLGQRDAQGQQQHDQHERRAARSYTEASEPCERSHEPTPDAVPAAATLASRLVGGQESHSVRAGRVIGRDGQQASATSAAGQRLVDGLDLPRREGLGAVTGTGRHRVGLV